MDRRTTGLERYNNRMEAYTDFAQVYDVFMDNAPYGEWHEYLHQTLRKYGIEKELVLDLGCGTGTLTERFAIDGYDMIGVDNSEEMLNIAIKKKDISGHEILYLLQDMREFELYGTVKAVICICDSLNYLLTKEDVLQTFRLVNNYLDPGGIFIFDFNTVYKYCEVIGDTTIAENREECSFIWENYYHEEERINEYDLTLFFREGERYRKFSETHYQRGYTVEEMTELVKNAGLSLLEICDAQTHGPVNEHSERVYMIAGECSK